MLLSIEEARRIQQPRELKKLQPHLEPKYQNKSQHNKSVIKGSRDFDHLCDIVETQAERGFDNETLLG